MFECHWCGQNDKSGVVVWIQWSLFSVEMGLSDRMKSDLILLMLTRTVDPFKRMMKILLVWLITWWGAVWRLQSQWLNLKKDERATYKMLVDESSRRAMSRNWSRAKLSRELLPLKTCVKKKADNKITYVFLSVWVVWCFDKSSQGNQRSSPWYTLQIMKIWTEKASDEQWARVGPKTQDESVWHIMPGLR